MSIKEHLLDDEGAATVTAAGIITMLVSLALAVAAIGAHVADSHRCRVAADLAAVAGADALYRGRDACAWAQRTAAENSAAVESCDLDKGDVVVELRLRRASATSRAGP